MGKGSQKRPSAVSRADMEARWAAAFGPRAIETAADSTVAAKPEPDPSWTGPGYRGEYTCPHGVGHGNHVHGCCHMGCCSRDDYPLRGVPNTDGIV